MKDNGEPKGENGASTTPTVTKNDINQRFRSAALASRSMNRVFGIPAERRSVNPFPVMTFDAVRKIFTDLTDPRRWCRKVPVRLQTQASDCGPACLAMVLAYHGIDVGLKRIREAVNLGRDGVSARTLLDTARRFGLGGRGVRCTTEGLALLPTGSVLFWNFGHYVVLERVGVKYLHVVDPALGRRKIPFEIVDDSFTGVALEFTAPLAKPTHQKPRMWERLARSHWRYLRYFFPRSRVWLPLVLTSLLLMLSTLVVPVATGYVAEHVVARHPLRGQMYWIAIIGVLFVVFLLLQIVRALAILVLQIINDKRVTLGVLEHLISLPYEYFDQRTAGDLTMRVRTSASVRQVLTNSALSTICDGGLILVYMALLLLVDQTLALVVIGLALGNVAVLVVAWSRQESLTKDALESQARAQGQLVELVEGIQTIKAAGLDGVAAERWSHSLVDELNTRVRSTRHLAIWTGISWGLQFVAPLVVLMVGSLLVSAGALSLGEVLAFASLAMGLFVTLGSLVQTGLQVSALGAPLARMGDILDAVPENAESNLQVVEGVTGTVELHDISFAYPGSAKPVIRDLDLNISPGDFIALTGPSGSGKSTMAMILAGLYLPTRGSMLVDGKSIFDLDRASLRGAISFVNQHTHLFAGSVTDNITWGVPVATAEQVIAVARLAEIHDEILTMPMGYYTMLGPGGAGLSGGQRQRIVLARALLRGSKLLILDEATSALDPRQEKRIVANLRTLDCTLVVVAHRLSALHEADQILSFENGQPVQRMAHPSMGNGYGADAFLAEQP